MSPELAERVGHGLSFGELRHARRFEQLDALLPAALVVRRDERAQRQRRRRWARLDLQQPDLLASRRSLDWLALNVALRCVLQCARDTQMAA